MFLTINIRRMWRTCLRKFLVAFLILLVLYLAYQWLGQPVSRPRDLPTLAMEVQ